MLSSGSHGYCSFTTIMTSVLSLFHFLSLVSSLFVSKRSSFCLTFFVLSLDLPLSHTDSPYSTLIPLTRLCFLFHILFHSAFFVSCLPMLDVLSPRSRCVFLSPLLKVMGSTLLITLPLSSLLTLSPSLSSLVCIQYAEYNNQIMTTLSYLQPYLRVGVNL